MNNKNIKPKWRKPAFVIGMALMAIAIIGMATGGIAGQGGISPEVATHSVIPNPTLNSNVSWQTFYNNWSTLEYNNGTANKTLNAGLSTIYKNPISINPTDIKTSSLQGKVAGLQWQNTSNWIYNTPNNANITTTISNTSSSLIITSTGLNNVNQFTRIHIPISNLPSSNLQYDYLTMIFSVKSSTAIINPVEIGINAGNNTASSPIQEIYITNETDHLSSTNETYFTAQGYITVSLAKDSILSGFDYVQLGVWENLPATSDTITTTITGMALTTQPITLGTQVNKAGATITTTANNGLLELNKFDPSIPYTEVNNFGYQVAVSQTLQNESVAQSSINDGNFIEEATYQGILNMPTAPDLTYGTANISMPVELPGTQYKVLNINGESYTNTVSKMNNGTFTAGTANPNQPNNVIVEAYYTASEWDSASHVPSFWNAPIQAMEYYWYVVLGIALGAVGLGAGIKGKSAAFRGAKK